MVTRSVVEVDSERRHGQDFVLHLAMLLLGFVRIVG